MSVGEPTFCNAVKSYEAGGYTLHETDRDINYANSRALYLNPKIQTRLMELTEMAGFNNLAVNAEHLKVLKQDKDLSNKMKAIAEYNKMTGRTQQDSGPGKITINIVNFEEQLTQQHGNNDPVPIHAEYEAFPAGDPREQSEEQGTGDSPKGWEDSDSGEQAYN